MIEQTILCIDDDEQFLTSLEDALPEKVRRLCPEFTCRFEFVASPQELLAVLDGGTDHIVPSMVISDQVMPDMVGTDLIEKLKGRYGDLMCILLTGNAGLESATYAINRQLLDQYVSKPIADLGEFAALVAGLLKRRHAALAERERTRQLARVVQKLYQCNHKIRTMQSAAEQMAMLSSCLKTLEFDQALGIVSQRVPALFGVRSSLLWFPPAPGRTEISIQSQCPHASPPACLVGPDSPTNGDQVVCCSGCDGTPKGQENARVVVPLSIQRGGQQAPWQGSLCMCNAQGGALDLSELLTYKGHLIREVLGAGLTNALLLEEARRQSRVDALTCVGTRRMLEECLEQECSRARRYHHPLCLAILDVDQLKRTNDTLGHQAGDQALQTVASVLRLYSRGTDRPFRYGGDEFVLLMPETSASDAMGALERIRLEIERAATPSGQCITISCGVAQWQDEPTKDETADLMRRADVALYQAKRSGRNRIELAAAALQVATAAPM